MPIRLRTIEGERLFKPPLRLFMIAQKEGHISQVGQAAGNTPPVRCLPVDLKRLFQSFLRASVIPQMKRDVAQIAQAACGTLQIAHGLRQRQPLLRE